MGKSSMSPSELVAAHKTHNCAAMCHLNQGHQGGGKMAKKQMNEKPLLVLKVGTSSILESTGTVAGFSLSNLGRLVDTVCHLRGRGYQVILVSSGAVGAGCTHMRLCSRPSSVVGKQAASAVGQCRMMRLYDDLFAMREMKIGQLILTRTDLLDRTRFVNFKNTLRELLRWNVVPIINENDSLATAQFRFGDNDTLAAYVAVSLEADWLFLLTDVDCLYTSNPRKNPDSKPIYYVGLVDEVFALLRADAGNNEGSNWGSGGMHTKIVAAKLACATGIPTILCNGEHPERVLDIIEYIQGSREREKKQALPAKKGGGAAAIDAENGDAESNAGYQTTESLQEMPYMGTIFAAKERTQRLHDQRRWVLSLPVHGRLYVDHGAAHAIVNGKKSLFAVGIKRVAGSFVAGEAVALCLISGADSASLPETPSTSEAPTSVPGSQDNTNGGGSGLLGDDSPSATPHEGENDEAATLAEDDDDIDTTEFARCLVRFGSKEIRKIIGKHSYQFKGILGSDCAEEEIAHRNTIIFVNPCVVYGCSGHCGSHGNNNSSAPAAAGSAAVSTTSTTSTVSN